MVLVDTPVLLLGMFTQVFRLYICLCPPQVVLGSIVTRCPSMSLAPSALVQLDSACELFSKVAKTFRAEKVLVCSLIGIYTRREINVVL